MKKKVPIKINKNTPNAYACYENTANNTMCSVQEPHTFL